MTNIVEQVQYRLKQDASEKDLIASSNNLNLWVKEQKGFLYRSLAKSAEGVWIDIIYWQDMKCALDASKAFGSTTEGQAMMEFIDGSTVIMQHLEVMTQVAHDAM
ncbi:hypothetical protein [Marinomonas sp. 2405UD68-3]|uniref:hypothetical protein n=1 Tax=Marinomonas sp. 2405UD68-3 TaxID=3391835 RepID=UPI0039C956E6